jgi:hypothetical protein
MRFDKGKLFDSPSDFFKLGGSAAMKLSATAAYNLCQEVSHRDILIIRIEGGIWSPGRFEARLDCIWDGLDPPVTRAEAIENNNDAAEFVRIESTMVRQDSAPYNAFIFTVSHISEQP